MKGFLTVAEFSKKMGYSRQAISKWIKEDKIKYIVLPNGHYRIPEIEVRRILEVK